MQAFFCVYYFNTYIYGEDNLRVLLFTTDGTTDKKRTFAISCIIGVYVRYDMYHVNVKTLLLHNVS